MIDATEDVGLESRVLSAAGELLELPEAERAGAIARLGADAALAARVRAVVGAAAAWPGFMESVALRAAEDPEPRRGFAAGTHIGPYSVVGLVGSGSMGDVYEAEGPAGGRVALKIVRPGVVTRELLRRFGFEAVALSRLNHGNIARLIDSGIHPGEDGDRPYLVMELVRGMPITEHAARSGADLRARVGLVVKVCEAVAHAHRAGIIHRDLKPANILVESATVEPKVLDFGVARVVDPWGTFSSVTSDRLIGSVPYMSPEQAGGAPADTRSDVYSLGAVLYELLSGRPPHDASGSLSEVVRAVREGVVAPVRRAAPGVPRDLEVVISAALAKDPAERYSSPATMADDLRRWLAGEPVLGLRPSAWSVLTGWLRRRRLEVAAGAIVIGVSVAALLYGASQRAAARAADVKSQAALDEFLAASQAMVLGVNDKLVSSGQSLEARAIALDAAVAYLDEAVARSGGEPRLVEQAARTYGRLASTVGSQGKDSLGQSQRAKDLLDRAIRLGEELVRRHPTAQRHYLMASLYEERAIMGFDRAADFSRCIRALEATIAATPPGKDRAGLMRRLPTDRVRLAIATNDAGTARQAVEEWRARLRDAPDDADGWHHFAYANRMLSELMLETDRAGALRADREAITGFRRSMELGLDHPSNRRLLARALINEATLLRGLEPADAVLRRAVEGLGVAREGLDQTGDDTYGRMSYAQSVYAFVMCGLRVMEEWPADGSAEELDGVRLEYARLGREGLAALPPLPAGKQPHPLEPTIVTAVERVVEQLAASRRSVEPSP